MIEAFELVTLFCELLSTRLQLLVETRSCPPDMKEGVFASVSGSPTSCNRTRAGPTNSWAQIPACSC